MLNSLIAEFSAGWQLPFPVIAARLFGSLILTAAIGFEREAQNRAAGLRTHILIGVAATVYTLMTLYLVDTAETFSDKVRMDPIRVIEAVTSGVAFLAAGMIVFSRGKVRGLTTGASMWLAAAVGAAVGLGLWAMAVLTTLIALLVIVVLRAAEKKFGKG